MKIESDGAKKAGIGANIARQNIQLFGFVKKVGILTIRHEVQRGRERSEGIFVNTREYENRE